MNRIFNKNLFNFVSSKYLKTSSNKISSTSKISQNNMNNDNMNKNTKLSKSFMIFLLSSSIFTSYLYLESKKALIEHISIKELNKKDDYNEINILNNQIVIASKNDNSYYKSVIPSYEYFEKHVKTDVPVYFKQESDLSQYLGPLLSIGIIGFLFLTMRKNMSGLKSIIEIDKSIEVMNHIKTRFSDVIGQKNAKNSVQEFVHILKNREKYLSLGVHVPRGALLSGPPGTGKTLIAKALAGECELPFINIVGSEFNVMFVGVGSSKIKNLYETAKIAAQDYGGCIIFIDEIDALGQRRNNSSAFGGHSERENTLNQLLTEMDGFDSHENVITFAATNRPELLDPALLRPGRFDRKISVDLPTIKDREDIFKYYFNKMSLKGDIIDNISKLSSKLTPGFSGADVANVVNESGIIALRDNKEEINEDHIKDAIDYVMMGSKKENILSEKEQTIVAYHESGHALLSYILKSVENPVKVSIIPREKGMLGFSQSEVSNENLYSKTKMEEMIMVLMGGRICEELFCNDVTNGASNDIEKATEIAKQYVNNFGFGFSNKFMNTAENNMYKRESSNFLCDDADKQVLELLNKKYEETQFLINENKNKIENMKNKLLEKETLYLNDIEEIIKSSS